MSEIKVWSDRAYYLEDLQDSVQKFMIKEKPAQIINVTRTSDYSSKNETIMIFYIAN